MPRSRILDNGRDTVTVFNDEQPTPDSYGNPIARPSAVGIVVRGCTMQHIGAGKHDGRIRNTYRLFTRSAAIGPWSRVEWKSKTFHVIDGPDVYTGSSGADHVSVILREDR